MSEELIARDEIERLREALVLSMERFSGIAEVMTERAYQNPGFMRASATRIRNVLEGRSYHDDIFAAKVPTP